MANFVDKFYEAVAPGVALKRAKARFELTQYERALDVSARYEGASKGRRTEGWTTVSGGSAVSETMGALATLRDRSRDLSRNTWAGRRAMDVLTNNIIGTGIRPSMDGESDVERRIKKWAKSLAVDADGLNNLYGLQALAVSTRSEAGESLILRIRQPASRHGIPLKIRVLEGDYLDEGLNEVLSNGNFIVQGVEFNRLGERVAYHLFKNHPGDMYAHGSSYERWRAPAEDVIHLFKALRPGQVRGIPDSAPVIIKLRDWDSYEDAQLVRQKIASCFTAFVRTQSDGMPIAKDPKKGGVDDALTTSLMPGLVQLLRPGEDVTFGSPPDVTGYKEYAEVTLHEIAAGFGISYESLTGDLKGVSFSAGRMGWLEFQRKIESDRALLYEPRLLSVLAEWILEPLRLMGIASDDDEIKWTPPRREMIDPSKETAASISGIRAGLTSRQSEIRSLGRDPEEVLHEIAQDNALVDALDLILDSDPRKQDKNGIPVKQDTE